VDAIAAERPISADFHAAMVATAAGEKLLVYKGAAL